MGRVLVLTLLILVASHPMKACNVQVDSESAVEVNDGGLGEEADSMSYEGISQDYSSQQVPGGERGEGSKPRSNPSILFQLITSLVSGIIGAVLGASGQIWIFKKKQQEDLLWDVRMTLRQCIMAMWNQDSFPEFQATTERLRIGASHPRVSLPMDRVKNFLELVERGWRENRKSHEYGAPEGGIPTTLLGSIEQAQQELDEECLKRLS